MRMRRSVVSDPLHCIGCGACVVACMDQNDLFFERGAQPLRRIVRTEEGTYPGAIIRYASLGCRHCGDAPCLAACAFGALSRDEGTGAVLTDRARCTGCRACSQVCPFGVPRFGTDGKLYKCTLCAPRLAAGLPPACVAICPCEALRLDEEE